MYYYLLSYISQQVEVLDVFVYSLSLKSNGFKRFNKASNLCLSIDLEEFFCKKGED